LARSVNGSIAAVLLAVALGSAPPAEAGFGEALRYGGESSKGVGSPFALTEWTHAFGVEPASNSTYVGDEGSEVEAFRLQKYNAAGAFLASGVIRPAKSLPAGTSDVEDIEGVAVDAAEGRVYALVTNLRSQTDAVDPGINEAGSLYALSTTPGGPKGKKLVPATGAKGEGLLVTNETLHASSEVPGKALLEPAGIAVDPATHEIFVLGEVDKGAEGMFLAIDRLNTAGELVGTYVAPTATNGEPHSLAVTASGAVYFEERDRLMRIQPGLSSGPELVFALSPRGGESGPFNEQLLSFGHAAEKEEFFGGQLSLASESSTSGRLYLTAEVGEVESSGEFIEESEGVLELSYNEAGVSPSVAEVGWTGGAAGEIGTAGSCEIGTPGEAASQVGAGSSGAVFVLESGTQEVIRFDGSGTHCPAASSAGEIALSIGSEPVTSVEHGQEATLTGRVSQADILRAEWNFGDGSTAVDEAGPGQLTQQSAMHHVFATAGTYTVSLVTHVDDLESPTVSYTRTVSVH
jgi:hypothetical protein